MKCCYCRKNEAVRTYEEVTDGKKQLKYYCLDCYSRLFVSDIGGMADKAMDKAADKINQSGKPDGAEKTKKETLKAAGEQTAMCVCCGKTEADFRASGMLGCEQCYTYLSASVIPAVLRMQGEGAHQGKTPENDVERKLLIRRLFKKSESEGGAADLSDGEDSEEIKSLIGDFSELTLKTVTSTRIRFARNVKGYPFPDKLHRAEAKKIIDAVGEELCGLNGFKKYELDVLDEEQTTLLLEKHLISPALIKRKELSAVFISSDRNISVMVNEEDHLREQYIFRGYGFYKPYKRLSEIDDRIAHSAEYAFDKDLGFLTACPSNLGTGMRASVMMFLPGLSKYRMWEELLPKFKANGITVRGEFGEGSAPDGCMYQVSNERTLGCTEAKLLSHMNEVTLNLCEMELRARRQMLESDESGYRDLCLRAYGLLTNCALLTAAEFKENLFKLRLGVALGFFEVNDMEGFNDFVFNMQPVTFRLENCPDKDVRGCDLLRAEIAGKVLKELVTRVI